MKERVSAAIERLQHTHPQMRPMSTRMRALRDRGI
jgi:hypothetical protein